jgi:hypothetical protein
MEKKHRKEKKRKERKKVRLIFYPHLQSIYLLFPSFNRVIRKPIVILICIYKNKETDFVYKQTKNRGIRTEEGGGTLKVILFAHPHYMKIGCEYKAMKRRNNYYI